MFIAALLVNTNIVEATLMPLNWRMNKEMCHIYTIIYYSVGKKDGILKFDGKWMEFEETILNEVSQSQKKEHGMFSLIYEF